VGKLGGDCKGSPNRGLVLVVRSGEAGKMGILGDMASLEGEGGREERSIWTGCSLSRASLAV
jgi:hypothetical protein